MKGRTESRGRREAGRRGHRLPQVGLLVALAFAAPLQAAPIIWQTVVNNGFDVPKTTRTFNSYGPPSVNIDGLVVFRGRTGGSQQPGQPITGIFQRDMRTPGSVETVVVRGQPVPAPNNTGATFNEFPAFARIDSGSAMIATRGQSDPVWQVIDPSTGETITKIGTAGIYTSTGGPLITGGSLLGAVPSFPQYQIPQPAVSSDGLRFDQFPGAPAAFDGNFIAFKGNFTENDTGRTGVFYRDVTGISPAIAVAWSGLDIPDDTSGKVFGSTAPPSAARGQIVFTGLDNEEAPTAGGIYRAKTGYPPGQLDTLVTIGQTIPGIVNASGTSLNRVGEALSFDGRYLAFWGAWGTETRTVTLTCPKEGNAAVRNACLLQSSLKPGLPNDANPNDPNNHTGLTTREVPVHQGILLKDTLTGELKLVAETGDEYLDFLFWTFSGRPPGTGAGDEGDDAEPPRWRSSAFIAADGERVVFKATEAALDVFGLYLDLGNAFDPFGLVTSEMLGEVLDPLATGLPIVALSIERDGFRNGWLAISASFASDEEGWAGIYIARIPEPGTLAMLLLAAGLLPFVRRTALRRA